MMVLSVDKYSGVLLYNEPLARYTTWRVGGCADQLYKPQGLNDLADFLQDLDQNQPVMWLGLGSNLLVRDGGVRGTVIATQGAMNEMSLLENGCVRAEAGVTCAKVARFCSRHALAGVEFLAGIPGTMGGAVAMNAGAFGGETWSYVEAVETIDHAGQIRVRTADEFKIAYRSVEGPEGEWFVAVHLRLQKTDDTQQDEIKQRIKALLEQRNQKQPIGLPSCGSVFRNPEGHHAAALIEQAGLKGECEGGACVSEKHANFIINTGTATANDIEMLINKVSKTVQEKSGIELIREVHIVGERELLDTQL